MNNDEYYSEEYISKVNKTYSPMTSRKQVMPSVVAAIACKLTDDILDFGAGKHAYGTMYLRDLGFDVTAYDIGTNFIPGIHDTHALDRRYDVVFANNVLNVQPSVYDALDLLLTIHTILKDGGKFICNYPKKPRKSEMTVEFLESSLKVGFNGVDRIIKEGYNTPMWVCTYDW